MSEVIKREERFIVLKIKDLIAADALTPTREFLRTNGIQTCECVVVESDWPEYEVVWQMIEARVKSKKGGGE